MTKINATDIPRYDMSNADETRRAIGKSATNYRNGDNKAKMNLYIMGVAIDNRVTAGDVRSEIADQYGLKQSLFSKAENFARFARTFEAETEDGDDGAKAEARLLEFRTYMDLYRTANPTWEPYSGSVDEMLRNLVSEDGDLSGPAAADMLTCIGAPSSAYMVITGAKKHHDDPRLVADQDDDGDDEGDDDDSGDEVPWQDRLTALIGQCKLEGATTGEILAVVKAAV